MPKKSSQIKHKELPKASHKPDAAFRNANGAFEPIRMEDMRSSASVVGAGDGLRSLEKIAKDSPFLNFSDGLEEA